MSEKEKQEIDEAWDEILNSCLDDIYNESDEETDKKLSEHKEIVKEKCADTFNINNLNTDTVTNGMTLVESSNELSNGEMVEPSLVIHEKATQTPADKDQIKWDQDVIDLFNEKFPNMDIYNMSLEDLKHLRDDVEALREEFSLIELAYKVLSNGAYGASANAKGFYFYNLSVAGDITGECRALTQYFWHHLEEFFHETIWKRKDLWEQFGFELDESKHELCRSLPVSCYSDTDSVTEDAWIYIRERTHLNTPGKEWTYKTISFKDFWDYLTKKKHSKIFKNEKGRLMCTVPPTIQTLDWEKTRGFEWTNIRYVMKHMAGKALYETESTESSRKIITTNDHGLMVWRDTVINTIRAWQIDQKRDKLICFFKVPNDKDPNNQLSPKDIEMQKEQAELKCNVSEAQAELTIINNANEDDTKNTDN